MYIHTHFRFHAWYNNSVFFFFCIAERIKFQNLHRQSVQESSSKLKQAYNRKRERERKSKGKNLHGHRAHIDKNRRTSLFLLLFFFYLSLLNTCRVISSCLGGSRERADDASGSEKKKRASYIYTRESVTREATAASL